MSNARSLVLMPASQLPAAIADMERQLAIPSDRRDVQRFVLGVSVALAPKRPAALQDPQTAKAFTAAMMEEVARLVLPRVVLEDAEIRARTAFDWFPTIKEVVDLCNAIRTERRKQLSVLKERLRDHEGYERARRLQEKERQEVVKDVQAAWGGDLTTDDILTGYDAIERIVREHELRAWRSAVRKGETWALDAMIYLADEWRAHPDWIDGKVQGGSFTCGPRAGTPDLDWWHARDNFQHIQRGEPLKRQRMVKR